MKVLLQGACLTLWTPSVCAHQRPRLLASMLWQPATLDFTNTGLAAKPSTQGSALALVDCICANTLSCSKCCLTS